MTSRQAGASPAHPQGSNTDTQQQRRDNMKALEEVKLVEVTLVLAVNSSYNALCGMDYIVVHDEAQLLGWSERDLEVKPKEEGQ